MGIRGMCLGQGGVFMGEEELARAMADRILRDLAAMARTADCSRATVSS